MSGWIMLLCMGWAASGDLPPRYWPEFPAPDRVLVSENHNEVDFGTGLLLHTLSGLVAQDTARRGRGELLWISVKDAPSYDQWLRRCLDYTGAGRDAGVYKTWDLIDRYRAQGVVKGYLLCRREPGARDLYEGEAGDTSVNVATSLCAVLGGVAVEEGLEAQAQQHGLARLLDVRDKDEAWLWSNYGEQLSHRVLGRQDPRSFVLRDALVAMKSPVISGIGPLYEQVLSDMQAGSPVLGWGLGMEDAQTGPSSRYGLFQTATNWCVNLPLLSSGATGLRYPLTPFRPPEDAEASAAEGPDTRYVSFILSDGDNVQWLMLNFCEGAEAKQYWACPQRGALPFGWTIPAMDLLQLCPYTLDYLRETASARDDFVLMSGGYYYPDWFGEKVPESEVLARHARRMSTYMARCGLHLLAVNLQDWDSESAARAYQTYARELPGLEGLFVFQYAPYTAGGGAIRWVRTGPDREIPVITARNAIWSGRKDDPREGTPARVATMLNDWAARPITRPEDRFAWVIVHCWSWFRPGETEEVSQEGSHGEGEARGYLPALWARERLAPNILPVTPSGLARRLTAAHRAAMQP